MRNLIIAFVAPLLVAAANPTPNANVALGGVCAYINGDAGAFQVDTAQLPARSRHNIGFAYGGSATVEEAAAPGCVPTPHFRFTEQGSTFRAEACLAPMSSGEAPRRVTIVTSGDTARRSASHFQFFQACTAPADGPVLIGERNSVPMGFKSWLDTASLPVL